MKKQTMANGSSYRFVDKSIVIGSAYGTGNRNTAAPNE